MASLGNLTYSVTINDEVTKELDQLREAVSSLQLQMTLLECDKFNTPKIESYSEIIAKQVEAKYKEMLTLAEQEAVDVARKSYRGFKLKRDSRGELVCCGMVVEADHLTLNGKTLDEYMEEWKALISEATLENPKPFIIQGGHVYINQDFIKEGTIQIKEKQ